MKRSLVKGLATTMVIVGATAVATGCGKNTNEEVKTSGVTPVTTQAQVEETTEISTESAEELTEETTESDEDNAQTGEKLSADEVRPKLIMALDAVQHTIDSKYEGSETYKTIASNIFTRVFHFCYNEELTEEEIMETADAYVKAVEFAMSLEGVSDKDTNAQYDELFKEMHVYGDSMNDLSKWQRKVVDFALSYEDLKALKIECTGKYNADAEEKDKAAEIKDYVEKATVIVNLGTENTGLTESDYIRYAKEINDIRNGLNEEVGQVEVVSENTPEVG